MREMQSHTAARYHFTLTRLATIANKTRQNEDRQALAWMWGNGHPETWVVTMSAAAVEGTPTIPQEVRRQMTV